MNTLYQVRDFEKGKYSSCVCRKSYSGPHCEQKDPNNSSTSSSSFPSSSSWTPCNEKISGYLENGYRGCQDRTESGKPCQKWTSQSPHSHSRTPSGYPNKGLGDHNYCRNPDSEPRGIWCYTTTATRWEYCDPLPTLPSYSWPLKRYKNETLVFSNPDRNKLIQFNVQLMNLFNDVRIEVGAVNNGSHGAGVREEIRKLEVEVEDFENIINGLEVQNMLNPRQ